MTLFIYSIIAGAILSVLWLTFGLSGMSRLTHFRLNRVILVAILLFSLALPVIVFRHIEPVAAIVEPVELVNSDDGVLVDPDTYEIAVSEPAFGWSWLPEFYVAGACLCALWLLLGLMPKFTPATYNGEPVGQWKNISFAFRI